jgi:hypothetical protein
MAHYRIYIKTNTTGATCKAGKYKLPEFLVEVREFKYFIVIAGGEESKLYVL